MQVEDKSQAVTKYLTLNAKRYTLIKGGGNEKQVIHYGEPQMKPKLKQHKTSLPICDRANSSGDVPRRRRLFSPRRK